MPFNSTPNDAFYPLKTALLSLKIARMLGLGIEACDRSSSRTPQTLLAPALLLSELFEQRVAILEGWSDFQNSVKAFQVLGLIADTVQPYFYLLEALKTQAQQGDFKASQQLSQRQQQFLSSRQTSDKLPVFPDSPTLEDRGETLDLLQVALWEALHDRPIVCTTSSNFGLALHEILYRLQTRQFSWGDRQFSILNTEEVNLTIWCPKRGSAIMRDEKDDILQQQLAKHPIHCQLRRYESRKERDGNAIAQVLEQSGLFFPTTPQSPERLTQLIHRTLRDNPHLKATVSPQVVRDLQKPIQGGIFGAIVPYLFLIEAVLDGDRLQGVTPENSPSVLLSLYNPTSIGATLAGFIEGDRILHTQSVLAALNPLENAIFQQEFSQIVQTLKAFPNGFPWSVEVHAVPDHHTRPGIAGAFDLEMPHIPGDGQKFMGLGSNGFPKNTVLKNIVAQSVTQGGAFAGKSHIHPTTHTMGYIAAALVFANDLQQREAAQLPELAGSFAVAGILQQAIEERRLSIEEVAWVLRRGGIGLPEFLALNSEDYDTADEFLQRAKCEGTVMATLADSFIGSLTAEISVLGDRVTQIRQQRSPSGCFRWPLVVAHRTGDYCRQPSSRLVQQIRRQQF